MHAMELHSPLCHGSWILTQPGGGKGLPEEESSGDDGILHHNGPSISGEKNDVERVLKKKLWVVSII